MNPGSRPVAVIGGGFAGISAAVELARQGARVTLLEARRTLGGRASSHIDEESGETLDNGQHLLMGSYTATRALLETLGTGHLVKFQKRLEITSLEPGGRVVKLKCPPLPSPAHLIVGLLTLKGLTLGDKIALLRSGPSLMKLSGEGLTVEEWLDKAGQTENLRERFWRPVAIAALNEDTRIAGATLLTSVLKEAFGGSASATGLGVPLAGLSDLYAAATRFIEEHGGEVRTGSPANSIEMSGGRVASILMRGGDDIECDGAILAVPHVQAARLLPNQLLAAQPALERITELGVSPIVSVNLWLDREVTSLGFFGLIGSPIQFIFNKRVLWDQKESRGTYLACVLSAAADMAGANSDALTVTALHEVRKYIPEAADAELIRSMVVREKQATFSGRPEVLSLRPPARTAIPNFALAGDWTDTGLPGTIEGAVRSGITAAGLILPK
jgi:squalene-associated FAD-dependent desaturase